MDVQVCDGHDHRHARDDDPRSNSPSRSQAIREMNGKIMCDQESERRERFEEVIQVCAHFPSAEGRQTRDCEPKTKERKALSSNEQDEYEASHDQCWPMAAGEKLLLNAWMGLTVRVSLAVPLLPRDEVRSPLVLV